MSQIEVPPVPDSVMETFLDACRAALEANWRVAGTFRPNEVDAPRGDALGARSALEQALRAAEQGDGADAILGYALAARSKATKAIRRHEAGEEGRYVPPSRGIFGI